MASSTVGKVIECRAAVAWAPNELKIETVQVEPPKTGEIRIRIAASGICHSDLFLLRAGAGSTFFPCILGHEGAGIVESIGEGVTSVAPGDHVIPLSTPQCRECTECVSTLTNLCSKNEMNQLMGVMSDGTSRFSCNGQVIKHNMGCSTFSEYTVVAESNICKINPEAPLDKICLIGCGVSTGYGAALNTAGVRPGSTVAVWGLGGVGLAAVMGAKKAGASRIIGIDINPSKAEIGKQFGLTDFVNPKDHEKPIEDVLLEMTSGLGLDYTFECCGIPSCMTSAHNSLRKGCGIFTLVGLSNMGDQVQFNPWLILTGRQIRGTSFGGWKSRDCVPKLVDQYVNKELMVDEFITHTLPIESINEAIDMVKKGECLRTVLTF